MDIVGILLSGVLTICLLGHSAVFAQNRISQNNFGQHKEHERLAIEKKRLELEALTPKKVVPSHSATLLLSSSTQILNQTTSCLDKSNEVIYFTSDGAFEYAMKDAADKNWDAIVQDCWVFVKLTVANNTLPASRTFGPLPNLLSQAEIVLAVAPLVVLASFLSPYRLWFISKQSLPRPSFSSSEQLHLLSLNF